jgi:hypothetical protein
MTRLRHSTTWLWLSLTAVLFSAALSAPVAASSCGSATPEVQSKASCETMVACCCAESVSESGAYPQVQSPGCDCSLQQAPDSSNPAEASARAFTMAFGLPITAALVAVDVIRGPCLISAEDHHPRAGATLRKPSRAPPADRR